MEDNRLKLLIIIIAGIAVISLFFAFQFYTGRQSLLNEYNIMKKDLSERNEALAKKIDSLYQEKRQIEEKFSLIQKELDNISREKDEWKQKYDLVSREKQELIDKFQTLSEERLGARPLETQAEPGSHLAQALKERAELEVEVGNLKNVLQEMQVRLNELNEGKKDLDLQVSKLKQEKQDLERQLVYNKDYSEKVIQKLSSDAARESKDKETVFLQLNEIRAENASIRGQIKILSSEKISLEKKLQMLDEEKQKVEARLIDLNQNLESRLDDITTLRDDLSKQASGSVDSLSQKAQRAKAVELPPIVVSSSGPKVTVSGGKILEDTPEAKIISINKENNFVIIDIGEASNIQQGSLLGVYRIDERIGDIEVVQIRKNISAADIKQTLKPFRVGDVVK